MFGIGKGVTRRRLAALAVVGAVAVAVGIILAPKVRGYVMHNYGPLYWDIKYYYLTYRHVSPSNAGDGGVASQILLQDPMGVDVDAAGNVYLSDRGRLIWKIGPGNVATVIGGTGSRGSSPDGVSATEADLGLPEGIGLDARGRVYFADSLNSLVLRIELDGTLTRVAGTGEEGYSGDGGLARDAALARPFDVRVDAAGDIYIADFGNNRIRKITPDGIITTVAGTGEPGYSGDGGPAREAQIDGPYGLFPTGDGGVFIADSRNNVVRLVDTNGVISTIAGTGERGFSGDGGPALAARLDSPQALYLGRDGRLYINDEHNHAIRVLDSEGHIFRVAGTGRAGWAETGQPGIEAPLNDPETMVVRRDGSVLITDGDNGRVVVLNADGSLHPFAGRPPKESGD